MSISQRAAARIARPAEAGAKPVTKAEKLKRLKRSLYNKLNELCRDDRRFGSNFLPENDEGRRMLIAQLRFGLSDEAAIDFAQWCEAELPELKRQARRMKWREVSSLIDLTLEEWEGHQLWQIGPPVDKTPEELEEWWKDRRKKQARDRQQRRREKLQEKQRELAKATEAAEHPLSGPRPLAA
jgi:hypothetical protein